ncbi:MAG: hypothetical protein JW723_01550 [Bacteroidales bacterium]|nr:hypothetical protein [Bacteroidales bacterium]
MMKCKCIKDYHSLVALKFDVNKFYDYEYVPSMGNYQAIYRVYYDNGKFCNFSFAEFREFFKTFKHDFD